MISLETAKALRDAGLVWDLQNGDFYFADGAPCLYYGPITSVCGAIDNKWVFAPRLDQLLSEIERRGWEWELGILTVNDGRCYMIDIALEALIKTDSEEWKSWTGDTPTEAAAQALLWILREGQR